MIKSFLRYSLACCSAVLFLLALPAPAHAQGIRARSGDVSANVGVNNIDIVQDKAHVEFGFSDGYNFIKQLALSGEFNYLPQGAYGNNTKTNIQFYGVNLRYSPWVAPFKTTRVIPYIMVGEGYARATQAGFSAANGDYFDLGIGTSFYITPSFGIRPEIRSEGQAYTNGNVTTSYSEARFTIAAFYQWGGISSGNGVYSSSNDR